MRVHWSAAAGVAALLLLVAGFTPTLLARGTAPAATAQACTFALNPNNVYVGPDASNLLSVSVSVLSGSMCAWTASSNASFLEISFNASGTGNGTVGYHVAWNQGADERVGTLTIAGQTFTVTQAPTCTYTFSALDVSVGIAGGSQALTLTTGPSCHWFATSDLPYLTLYDATLGSWTAKAQGIGSGTLSVAVAANLGSRRTGTIKIRDGLGYSVNLTVQQDGTAVPSDFTGDGKADLAVFRPSSGTWIVQGAADSQLGQTGDIPVPGDYDGDGIVDKAVFRPSDATWRIGSSAPIQFGQVGDLPVPGDYDGDGVNDIAVFRTVLGYGQWYIRGQGGPFVLGLRGDIPVAEDYDGDGKTDLAVFRPGTGMWYIAPAASGFTATTTVPFGLGGFGDIPFSGDFDGDGKADVAVGRPTASTAFVKQSSDGAVWRDTMVGVPMALDTNGDGRDELVVSDWTGHWSIRRRADGFTDTFGAALGGVGDLPAAQRPRLAHVSPTDVDGDGPSDFTVFRPAAGTWHTRLSRLQYATTTTHTLGQPGDIKVPGDYDGDRVADYAVYRPSDGTWHLDFMRGGVTLPSRVIQWGLPGDTAVPADYDGDGRTDIAVWRPSDGVWYILDSSSDFQTPRFVQWGLGYFDDVPVPGDFDGDGKADLAVFRPEPGLWYLKLSSGSDVVKQWGLGYYDDVPLVGDFDGDGRAEITVYRPAYGLWYSMDPLTGVQLPLRQFGLPGDVPLIEDFDADGITDLTVYRPSGNFWFTQRSTLGFFGPVQWGQSGDEPLLRIR